MIKQEVVVPTASITVDRVRFRNFYPIDRESPIFEVILEDKVIFDVARSTGTDLSSEFEIAIHECAAGLQITVSALNDILHTAEKLITAEETNP